MIKSKIKDVSQSKGVKNAYQLGVLIGVTPNDCVCLCILVGEVGNDRHVSQIKG